MVDSAKQGLAPHHCGISVVDLETSIAWYNEMLGFTLEKRIDVEGLPAKIAFLKNENFRIELFQMPDAAPLPEDRKYPDRDLMTHGTKHMAYQVADINSLIEKLKAKGVEVVIDVNELDNSLMSFIRDHDGNLVELIQLL